MKDGQAYLDCGSRERLAGRSGTAGDRAVSARQAIWFCSAPRMESKPVLILYAAYLSRAVGARPVRDAEGSIRTRKQGRILVQSSPTRWRRRSCSHQSGSFARDIASSGDNLVSRHEEAAGERYRGRHGTCGSVSRTLPTSSSASTWRQRRARWVQNDMIAVDLSTRRRPKKTFLRTLSDRPTGLTSSTFSPKPEKNPHPKVCRQGVHGGFVISGSTGKSLGAKNLREQLKEALAVAMDAIEPGHRREEGPYHAAHCCRGHPARSTLAWMAGQNADVARDVGEVTGRASTISVMPAISWCSSTRTRFGARARDLQGCGGQGSKRCDAFNMRARTTWNLAMSSATMRKNRVVRSESAGTVRDATRIAGGEHQLPAQPLPEKTAVLPAPCVMETRARSVEVKVPSIQLATREDNIAPAESGCTARIFGAVNMAGPGTGHAGAWSTRPRRHSTVLDQRLNRDGSLAD